MIYVFGGTFICEDAEAAKRITFHDSIRTRSVTLDGDVYDPQGSLSGGSAPSGNRTLIEVQELLEVETRLKAARRELEIVEKEEAVNAKVRDEWRLLGRDLEIKEHELRLLEEQVGGSNASRASWLSLITRSYFDSVDNRSLQTLKKHKRPSKSSRMQSKLRKISNKMLRLSAPNLSGT